MSEKLIYIYIYIYPDIFSYKRADKFCSNPGTIFFKIFFLNLNIPVFFTDIKKFYSAR